MSLLLADIDATCAALGYSDGQRYQAEPDAIQGLKHLIWILRRDLDNHEYRRHLVLQTDLVYMLPDYVDDDEYADVLIRLLVILTNPTLLLLVDGPPKDNHGRKVFLELIDILQGYKSAFTRDKIWSALFGKLKKSLEILILRNVESSKSVTVDSDRVYFEHWLVFKDTKCNADGIGLVLRDECRPHLNKV
ncbi:hypothetical protein DOY81_011134 [Sarcophaga bullata]|nr:hypothetical protein DOY81_011134 [Sarcophaga bullata]